MNAENLLAAGFTEFKDPFKDATRCFQKRVWTDSPTDNKTAYFINVYYYQFDLPGETRTVWELDMAFGREDWDDKFPYCWIKYQMSSEATVEEVESMAEAIYIANGGIPYGD